MCVCNELRQEDPLAGQKAIQRIQNCKVGRPYFSDLARRRLNLVAYRESLKQRVQFAPQITLEYRRLPI